MNSTIEDFLKEIKTLSNVKVCIIDNSTITFLDKIKGTIDSKTIFSNYDYIFIPQWVEVEINDSTYRNQYLQNLISTVKGRTIIVDEMEYNQLCEFKEQYLFDFFLQATKKLAQTHGFLHQLKNRNNIEDLEYEKWIIELYEKGFLGEQLSNGRIKKKNAGEVSICVLANLLAFFFQDHLHSITIFSNDRDTYDYTTSAVENIHKKIMIDVEYTSITYKSNDFIIYELYHKYANDLAMSIIKEHKKDYKRIKYTRLMKDGSVEEKDKVMDPSEFLNLIKDPQVHIIF